MIKILHLEDDDSDAELIRDTLGAQGIVCEVTRVETRREYLEAMERDGWDLILSDFSLPAFDGMSALKLARERRPEVPFIFVTGALGDEMAVETLKTGATDYILKHRLGRLATAVHRARREVEISRTQRQLEATVASHAREIAEANERLTILDHSKNDFLNLISHEFRTPLCGLLDVGDCILDKMLSTPEKTELQGLFDRSRRRILSILDHALLLTHIDVDGERFRSVPISLSAALSSAIEMTAEFADSRHVTLSPTPADQELVLGDEDLLVSALHALLETAVKFSEEGETVRLKRNGVIPGSPRVTIESTGRTIPSSALVKFFDLFSTDEAITRGGDLGLGPPLAHRILALFGASVSVENRESFGIRLAVSF